MPLAKVHGVIARALQQSSEGDFARGQAHVLVRNQVLLTIFVVHRLVELFRIAIGPQYLHELRGSRRELEAKPGGVASRHQCGARGRAGRIAGVADPKVDALLGDRINVGGRDGATCDPTAMERDVVHAQIVGNNQDDIGLPGASRSGFGFRGACLPLHLAGGRIFFAQHILHHQQCQSDSPANCVKAHGAQDCKRD